MQTHSRKGPTASFQTGTSQFETGASRKEPVSLTLIACGTTRRFITRCKAVHYSLMQHSFYVLALPALITYSTGAGLLPKFPGRDVFHLTLQVWLEKGAHKFNVDPKGVILKGYDLVAYFTQHKAVKGNPKYQTTYQGATYYFSSAANLAIFKKDPSKYAPQYGGFCANGTKNRKAVDIDPTVFFILKGKLYVCASPAAEKEFRANQDANIERADQNWDEQYEWFYGHGAP